jgi:hypothetical protein
VGQLIDRLMLLSVEVQSPDGRITADVRGEYQITVRFRGNCYRFYTEASLSQQLARLATLAWTHYRREYVEIVDAFLEEPVRDDDDKDLQFRERLTTMVITGTSTRGRIGLRSQALVRWTCDIQDGTIRALDEHEFLTELDSAVVDVLADHRRQLRQVTDEVYGTGLPTPPPAPVTSRRNR